MCKNQRSRSVTQCHVSFVTRSIRSILAAMSSFGATLGSCYVVNYPNALSQGDNVATEKTVAGYPLTFGTRGPV